VRLFDHLGPEVSGFEPTAVKTGNGVTHLTFTRSVVS
jgi:hypothetical protein